jgi:hypothetical protein
VEDRLTPSFQLQPSSRRPLGFDGRKRLIAEGERRTGPALRCGGLFGRAPRSKLDL